MELIRRRGANAVPWPICRPVRKNRNTRTFDRRDVEGSKPAKKKFKTYPIGFFYIDIAEVRTEEGKLHLFASALRYRRDRRQPSRLPRHSCFAPPPSRLLKRRRSHARRGHALLQAIVDSGAGVSHIEEPGRPRRGFPPNALDAGRRIGFGAARTRPHDGLVTQSERSPTYPRRHEPRTTGGPS